MSAGISGLVANTCSLLVNAVAKLFVNGSGAIATADGNYGESGQILKSAGSAAQAEWGSAVNNSAAVTASGTAVDFTDIPSWVKRITLNWNSISTSGTSTLIFILGTSTGFITSGYKSALGTISATGTVSLGAYTAYFGLQGATAAGVSEGTVFLTRVANTNTWKLTGTCYRDDATDIMHYVAGGVVLPDALTQLRVTTANGTDTFDAGTISISWE